MMRMSLSCFLMKRVVSTLPLEKSFFKRNALNLSYQALGACFKPYKAFDNLKTWLGKSCCSKPGGCST